MPRNTVAAGQSVPPSPVATGVARRQRLAAATRALARLPFRTPVRTLAGTLGAYGLTAQITVAASLLLSRFGMTRVEAVTAATLASFAVFAVISMAVFHAHSVLRACLWLAGASVPLALLGWVMAPA